jgi:hypothetical protein
VYEVEVFNVNSIEDGSKRQYMIDVDKFSSQELSILCMGLLGPRCVELYRDGMESKYGMVNCEDMSFWLMRRGSTISGAEMRKITIEARLLPPENMLSVITTIIGKLGCHADWVTVNRKVRGLVTMVDLLDDLVINGSEAEMAVCLGCREDNHCGTVFGHAANGYCPESIHNTNLQSSSVNIWLDIIIGQLYTNNIHYILESFGFENDMVYPNNGSLIKSTLFESGMMIDDFAERMARIIFNIYDDEYVSMDVDWVRRVFLSYTDLLRRWNSGRDYLDTIDCMWLQLNIITGPVLSNNSSCMLDRTQRISSGKTGPATRRREEVDECSSWMYMHSLTDEDIWTFGIGDAGSGEGYRLIQTKIDKLRYMEGVYLCSYYQISIGDHANDNIVARSGAEAPIGDDLFRWLTYICNGAIDNGELVFQSDGSDSKAASESGSVRGIEEVPTVEFGEYLAKSIGKIMVEDDDPIKIGSTPGEGMRRVIEDDRNLNERLTRAREEYVKGRDVRKKKHDRGKQENMGLRLSQPGGSLPGVLEGREELLSDWEEMHKIRRGDMDILRGEKPNKKFNIDSEIEGEREKVKKEVTFEKESKKEERRKNENATRAEVVKNYIQEVREDLTEGDVVVYDVDRSLVIPNRLYIKKIMGDGKCATHAIMDDEPGDDDRTDALLRNYGVRDKDMYVHRHDEYIHADAIMRGYRAVVLQENKGKGILVKVLNSTKDNENNVKYFRQTMNHFDRLYEIPRNGAEQVYKVGDSVSLYRPTISRMCIPSAMAKQLAEQIGNDYVFDVVKRDMDRGEVEVLVRRKNKKQKK